VNNSPDISAENPDQTGLDSPDETDIDDTLTRDNIKHLSVDKVFPAFRMLSSDAPEPTIEAETTADTAPPTIEEIQTAFRQSFGEPADQHIDPDQLKDGELVSIDGTVSWLPGDEVPIGYDSEDYTPADDWHFDTAIYGGALRGRDEQREVYIFERNNGEQWAAGDADRISKMAEVVGLTEPQLLDQAEINTSGQDDAPIQFDLDVGRLYLNPVSMTTDEVDAI